MNAPLTVVLRRGGLYLGRELHARYFGGIETAILLRRENDLLILPVANAAAGGYLMKLRNAAGDRVIMAADFFRAQGSEDEREGEFAVAWDTAQGGLVAAGFF